MGKGLTGLGAWLAAGAAVLAWSAVRAGKGDPVWPGFLGSDGQPPGVGPGALETVLAWPAPALYYFSHAPGAPSSSAASSATPQLRRQPGAWRKQANGSLKWTVG